jgi:hypothetical protein
LAAAALSLPTFLLEQIVALETHHLGKKNKNKNKNPEKTNKLKKNSAAELKLV